MRFSTFALLSTLFVQSSFATTTKDIVLAEKITTAAAAVTLAKGSYIFTNVATGQKLTFVKKSGRAKFDSFVAKSGSGTPIQVIPTGGGSTKPWYHLQVGSKCASSAWGSGGKDGPVIPYACISARTGKNTLEPTKQNWIMTPVSAPLGATSSAAGTVLLQEQNLSVATRQAALKAAFGKRGLVKRSIKRRGGAHKRSLEKRNTVTSGTFYIIPSDHLIDQIPKAISSSTVSVGGATEAGLVTWVQGDKKQQWKVTIA